MFVWEKVENRYKGIVDEGDQDNWKIKLSLAFELSNIDSVLEIGKEGYEELKKEVDADYDADEKYLIA